MTKPRHFACQAPPRRIGSVGGASPSHLGNLLADAGSSLAEVVTIRKEIQKKIRDRDCVPRKAPRTQIECFLRMEWCVPFVPVFSGQTLAPFLLLVLSISPGRPRDAQSLQTCGLFFFFYTPPNPRQHRRIAHNTHIHSPSLVDSKSKPSLTTSI